MKQKQVKYLLNAIKIPKKSKINWWHRSLLSGGHEYEAVYLVTSYSHRSPHPVLIHTQEKKKTVQINSVTVTNVYLWTVFESTHIIFNFSTPRKTTKYSQITRIRVRQLIYNNLSFPHLFCCLLCCRLNRKQQKFNFSSLNPIN